VAGGRASHGFEFDLESQHMSITRKLDDTVHVSRMQAGRHCPRLSRTG